MLSNKNSLNSIDFKSILMHTLITIVSILLPLGVNYVEKLNLSPEILSCLILVLNTAGVILKKYKQDGAITENSIVKETLNQPDTTSNPEPKL